MSDKLREAAKAFMKMQNIQPSCADFFHKTKELHSFSNPCKPLKKYMKVVDALRAALAEPEQEYICKCGLRVVPHQCKTDKEF